MTTNNGRGPAVLDRRGEIDPVEESAKHQAALRLERVQLQRMEVPIVGVTPLIAHKWSEKAKWMMANPDQVKKRKDPRDPEADYEAARYRLPDGTDGFPNVAFKAAIVYAARLFDGVTMTALKQWLFVAGEGPEQLVRIDGPVSRREDMVRVGQGVADIRWRPQYDPWRALLTVDFVATALTPTSVLALIDAAGIGGVGEWRPSSPKGATGSYGRFQVDDSAAGISLTVPK